MKAQNFFEISEVAISYRSGRFIADRNKINSSMDASEIGREVAKDHLEYKEAFYIILLNNSNYVLGVSKLSEGGMTGTMVDVRILFQTILKAHATSFIAFHNHPSGTLKASEADKRLTHKLKDAATFLDIKFLDHLIITQESYLSFADEGIL